MMVSPRSNPPPRWLAVMADQVASLMHAMDIMAPIGCHFFHARFPKDQWEVAIFVGKTETIGGRQDGSIVSSRFTIDLEDLIRLFAEITSFHWQALSAGPEDELGPHISLEGYYEGHPVWLRILSEPPVRFTAGRYAQMGPYEMLLNDIW